MPEDTQRDAGPEQIDPRAGRMIVQALAFYLFAIVTIAPA